MSRLLSPSLRDSLIGFAISEIIVARIAVRARRGIAVLRFGEAVSIRPIRLSDSLHDQHNGPETKACGTSIWGAKIQ